MANIQVNVDDKIKKEAEKVLSQLGMTTSSATRIFLMQVIHDQAFPFQPHLKEKKKEK